MGLKGVPPILCRPEIMGPISGLGHGDIVAIVGRGFSPKRAGVEDRTVCVNGQVADFLRAMLALRSLDAQRYTESPALMMAVRGCDSETPALMNAYRQAKDVFQTIIDAAAAPETQEPSLKFPIIAEIDVEAFYKKVSQAGLIIKVVDDPTPYGNLILILSSSD